MPSSPATKFAETSSLAVRGFFGGLNLRDAPDELAPGESPDLWNVVLDERGGFGARLGMVRWNLNAYPGGPVSAIFEWHKGEHVVVQAGPSLYLDGSIVAFKTFTTAARCGFAEFAGKLFVIHPADGTWYSDGTAVGTVKSVTGPKGSALAVWQNRLWANVVNSPRLVFSAIGSGDQWTPQQTTVNIGGGLNLPAVTVTVASTAGFDPTGAFIVGTGVNADTVSYTGLTATTFTGCTGGSHAWANGTVVTQGANYNDLIEKDEEPIVNLKGASGQDVIGQPGLIAFKERSTYRVNDPDTGAYTTLDPEIGCASNAAAVVVLGRVYTISEAGINWTDGNGPMRAEGDKLRPLWSEQQLAYDRLDLWCAGRRGQHVVFSVPTRGKTANDLAMEHYPATKADAAATVVGSNAASCYCLLTAPDDMLLGGQPEVPGAPVNVVPNPGFEVDTASWTVTGGALTRQTVVKHSGAAAGLLTAAGGDAIASAGGDTGALRLGMLPGHTYKWSVWVYVPAGSSALLSLLDNAGGYAGTYANSTVTDAWELLTVTRTIRPGATEAFCRIETLAGAGKTIYVDDASLTEPSVPGPSTGQVYEHATGGTDDGAPITSWFQTAWFAPHPERMARIRTAILEGRGDFTVYVKSDYSRGQGVAGDVQIERGGFRWNNFLWNDGSKWGPDSFAGYSQPMPSLGVCRVLSFRCEATTTGTKASPGLSGSGTGPAVGAWGVYAIHLKTVPLRQL